MSRLCSEDVLEGGVSFFWWVRGFRRGGGWVWKNGCLFGGLGGERIGVWIYILVGLMVGRREMVFNFLVFVGFW